jgi:hypothetical protein
MFILDFTAPGFLRLSQGNQVNVVTTTTLPGPLLDDASVTVTLGAPASPCSAAIAFHGTS